MLKFEPRSKKTRFWEIIIGITTWTLLLLPIWAAYFIPVQYGYFLLFYVIFLLVRLVRGFLLFFYGMANMRKALGTDWISKINEAGKKNDYERLKHIIIVPFYREKESVLEPLIKSLLKQDIDTKKISICLSYEARVDTGKIVAENLKKDYEKYFDNIWINAHELKPDEVAGKGSNTWSAAMFLDQIIMKSDSVFNKDLITITASDCDSIFDKKFFSQLSYKFLTLPDRDLIWYAASMTYMQNFWQLPLFSKILNTNYSYYNLIALTRKYTRFIHISTFCASYKLLKSIGFYEKNIISDDYHIFFVSLFKNFYTRTEPIWTFMDSDACEGDTMLLTAKAQFHQLERWAWGVEDLSYILQGIFYTLKQKNVKLKNKLYVIMRSVGTIFDHMMWPTGSIIFLVGSFFVTYFNPKFTNDIFWFNLPNISSLLVTITSVFVINAIVVSWMLRPKLEFKSNRRKYIFYIFEFLKEAIGWILSPTFTFVFGTLPAIFAHTKLLLGKYLGFRLTEKK